MDVLTLQPLFAVGALLGSLYAASELVRSGSTWWRQPWLTVARIWLVVALGLVGIEYLLFGNHAVLLLARQFDLPAQAVQLGFLTSILVAVLVWARE